VQHGELEVPTWPGLDAWLVSLEYAILTNILYEEKGSRVK
jgi:hypothetical protein